MRALLAIAALALCGCTAMPRETLLQGETMGSAWTVKIAGRLPAPRELLQAGVQARFEAVDQALSTYRQDSALSRFNADDRGEWLDVDAELAEVMGYGLGLAAASGGAYDVTVGPLVNLWGFGPDPAREQAPEAAAIGAARARVGYRQVEVDVAARRARKPAGVRIDLSSLGKGRGVDRVAGYLDSMGVTDYLIDLSGKLRARGRNGAGVPWRVAVEQPAPDDPGGTPRTLPAVVALRDASVATAGDYRRYFESGGHHYSHIIDPRTGYPVSHATVSATAMAPTCMAADALATVFMVMEPGAALRLADDQHVPALLISRERTGFRLVRSTAWPAE
ncbi:MAG TPA: FAD:protein FMN transferase [Steroidobacteraceae bacterium]|nr:FAD:protein FMN transferase [Steroidobacteraceae bacterium]